MTSNATDDFDILIIGGGTAGSVLAARLSSDLSLRILVLEAGQNRNEDANVRIPGLMGKLLGNPSYDWQFQTSPEAGLNERVIQQPRGKLWGGSSAINSHALIYPSRGYHDGWGSLIGSKDGKVGTRWDWEGIGKYYKRFQTLQKPSEDVRKQLDLGFSSSERAKTDEYQGEKGQLDEDGEEGVQASFPVTPHVLQKAWSDAIKDLRYTTLKDPVEGEAIGGSTTTNAIDALKGERSHAGVAFLESSTKRENLVVRSNVLVEKILFDEKKKDGKLVATGVIYSHEGLGEKITVHASKELIVCAGVFGSPKVMELSGIGQSERLSKLGVECLHDLKGVGENLQDHLNFGPSVEVLDSIQTSDVTTRDPAIAQDAKKLYEAKHEGPLAEGAAYSFSYLSLKALSTEVEERALAEIVDKTLHEASSITDKGLQAQYKIIERMIQDPKEATATVFMTRKQRYTPASNPAPGNYMTIIAMLSYPFSRGSSHITSTIPSTPPRIKFNYLQHPLDMEVLSRHVLQLGQIIALPALSRLLKPNGNTLPTGFPRKAKEIEDVEGYLRQHAATNYHPVGTCAMMSEDFGGVVDESLIVYGTANVRVCDASIIPIVPRGNILSTVYALAEKGADIVKEALACD